MCFIVSLFCLSVFILPVFRIVSAGTVYRSPYVDLNGITLINAGRLPSRFTRLDMYHLAVPAANKSLWFQVKEDFSASANCV